MGPLGELVTDPGIADANIQSGRSRAGAHWLDDLVYDPTTSGRHPERFIFTSGRVIEAASARKRNASAFYDWPLARVGRGCGRKESRSRLLTASQ